VNSQQLLYINIGLGVLILLYFIFGRSATKKPTRLNLKNPDTVQDKTQAQIENQTGAESAKTAPLQVNSKMTILEPEAEKNQQKNLAIFFIFNGHDWEAYNVLGLAQGASLKESTVAYQKLLQTADPQSYPFYEAAYSAILVKKRRDVL
jgi:hypothetical protein